MHGAKTWVEIDEAALINNIKKLKGTLSEGSVFCAILKANAYGHGTDIVSNIVAEQGITEIGVDSVDEAIAIRKLHPEHIIFILGYTVPERLDDVIKYHLIQTVYNEESIMLMALKAREQKKLGFINLKIETGTQRQGVGLNHLRQTLITIKQAADALELIGISTHFADAENITDPSFTKSQFRTFAGSIDQITNLGFNPPYKHIACSAAAILNPETHLSMSRLGIALYGLWPSESIKKRLRSKNPSLILKPALTWKTRIAQIKDVPSGASIGYGRFYKPNRPIRIAVLPIGYYDGYDRGLSSNGNVLVKGQLCSIVGRICMNMCMIDISTVPKINVSDPVTLLGKQGMHEFTADSMAERLKTINYEITTRIRENIPRVLIPSQSNQTP